MWFRVFIRKLKIVDLSMETLLISRHVSQNFRWPFNSQETQSKWACMILVFYSPYWKKFQRYVKPPSRYDFLPPNCTLDLHKTLTNTSKHLGHFFHDFSNLSTCRGKKKFGTSKPFYHSLFQKISNELKIIEFGQCLILQPLI